MTSASSSSSRSDDSSRSSRSRSARAARPSGDTTRAAIAGIVGAAAGMAASELAAGLVPPLPSLVIAVGTLVIALQPPGAKDLVASLFGTNDKLALNVAVILVALLVGALTGIAARRNFGRAVAVFGAFGALGFVGAWQAELVPPVPAAIGAAIGVGAGLLALRVSLDAAFPESDTAEPRLAPMPDWSRRQFLFTSAGLVVAAVAAGSVGRLLLTARRPATPIATTLPPVANALPPLAPDQALSAPGLTPIVMPNNEFYRIDTALLVPQVDVSNWQLKVDGMVSHPLTFTYDQLLAMPLFEQWVTIACVSNEVGGNLVGNAKWTGVHLKEILAQAGIDPKATQIVGRSVDGFTTGFPTAWALDPAREPMIALGMNGSPLPADHGYPARLIVPGLYGYVSATKWLSEIQLTTWEAFNAYWINLGWSKTGPILTQSRIDHPHGGDQIAAGPTWIDGIAWAPDRGITRVEVRIDDGVWQQAQMSRAISKATWVQWMLPWQAAKGTHHIEVRATDATGDVQTDRQTDPAPDGARGHHRVQVTVG